VLNVGVAAHITAAAEGGPRHDKSLTPEQRADISNGIWLCQTHAKIIDNDIARFSADLLRAWKKLAEQRALSEIGRSHAIYAHPEVEKKTERIQAQLQLRDELKAILLKKPGTCQQRGRYLHPYEKFSVNRILIRSLDDTVYPDRDESPGISSWFRVEPFDFYHNGIEVILTIQYALFDADGYWRPELYGETLDLEHYKRVKVWVIGRIPFRNIRAYDADGDEYYNDPHLFCAFADNGDPYEAVRYAICADDDDWDWPLDDEKRIQEKL
jgi:hypothetical protein